MSQRNKKKSFALVRGVALFKISPTTNSTADFQASHKGVLKRATPLTGANSFINLSYGSSNANFEFFAFAQKF